MEYIRKKEFSSRLRKLFGEGRGAKTKLAQAGGVNHTVASRWYDGETLPSVENLAAIASHLNCSLDWLLYGKGNIYELAGSTGEAISKYMPIRIVGTASANPNATIEWEEIEHEVTEMGPAVAIRVHDDSMEPLARQGQLVLAIPDADIRDGDLVVVKIHRKGVYFKRAFLRGREEIELQSANPVRPQPSMIVPASSIVKQYRVIGVKFE